MDDEGHVIPGLFGGESALTVGEINKPLQVLKLALSPELVNVGKDRAEIRPPQTADFKLFYIALKILLTAYAHILLYAVIALDYVPIAALMFYGSAARSGMNALINGSGNYVCNFATAIFDGIIMRIGLAVLFGILLNGGYLGFWLGDALAGFTPFVIGSVFYVSGAWKKGRGKAKR